MLNVGYLRWRRRCVVVIRFVVSSKHSPLINIDCLSAFSKRKKKFKEKFSVFLLLFFVNEKYKICYLFLLNLLVFKGLVRKFQTLCELQVRKEVFQNTERKCNLQFVEFYTRSSFPKRHIFGKRKQSSCVKLPGYQIAWNTQPVFL